ncbi:MULTISPECIES: PIN domain-containing protein [Thermus]|uniref:PIN domain-containing protein n=1 Tax=Thermus thermophilus TaxID=274 RepID=A0A7R7YJ07_THETH|nr:hypothetical protein TthHB5018_09250 [Thermus thermophilus]
MPPRVFLDANILFSAALGGEVWDAIWAVAEKGRVLLLTSPYCLLEAQENLWCKRPSALTALEERLALVEVVEEAKPEPWMEGLLPPKDLPVFAAAVAAGARVLLTGDTRHFGPLMDRPDLPLRVLTPAAFIRTFRPGSLGEG